MNKLIALGSISLGAPLLIIAFQNAAPANQCSEAVMANLKAPATDQAKWIRISCNVKLKKSDVITKQVILEGNSVNGIVFDCGGGKIIRQGDSIAIRSRRVTDTKGNEIWLRPENVIVRNCQIEGAIRVSGMDLNANGNSNDGALRKSSQLDAGHTLRAQAAAPRNILLEKLNIIGSGRIPLYISPGVTHLTLRNSTISGDTAGVAIYLDAESAFNVIQNNHIRSDTENRELIAIDGSAHNRIIGNYFAGLNNGGIFIYRNCGEGGTIRHQTPQHNHLINNTFFYRKYKGEKPSIWVGSREGDSYYCDYDKGFPFGSSINDEDFAFHNVIAQNQIYILSPAKMIRLGDKPNIVLVNKSITKPPKTPVKSGCYIESESRLINHGEKIIARESTNLCFQISCQDGMSVKSRTLCPADEGKIIAFSCRQRNSGSCQKSISCPSDFRIKDVRAVCNLETDYLSESSVKKAPWNKISVLRTSDVVSDGYCEIQGSGISSGNKNLMLAGLSQVDIQCSEKADEKSQGDCEIRGELRCVK